MGDLQNISKAVQVTGKCWTFRGKALDWWHASHETRHWPLSEPRKWVQLVNEPQTEAEVAAIRQCILRGCPYGNDEWVQHTAESLDLRSTLRPRGRPKLASSR